MGARNMDEGPHKRNTDDVKRAQKDKKKKRQGEDLYFT
jgi:hypothetical protein